MSIYVGSSHLSSSLLDHRVTRAMVPSCPISYHSTCCRCEHDVSNAPVSCRRCRFCCWRVAAAAAHVSHPASHSCLSWTSCSSGCVLTAFYYRSCKVPNQCLAMHDGTCRIPHSGYRLRLVARHCTQVHLRLHLGIGVATAAPFGPLTHNRSRIWSMTIHLIEETSTFIY